MVFKEEKMNKSRFQNPVRVESGFGKKDIRPWF
jgi:hypothetical protein